MKSILIVSGDFPYPPISGGRLDLWNRIELLNSMGFCIDLVYTGKDIEQDKRYFDDIRKYINDIYPVYRKNRIQDMLSLKPLQVESRKKLSNVVFKKNYDYIILEGDYVACILDNPTLNFTHIILRSHNNEYIYFLGLAKSTNNLLKKIYYYTECLKFKIIEDYLFKKIKNIMFISYDEKVRADHCYKSLNSVFLPPTISQNMKIQPLEGHTIVTIGSLFMENNKEGIRWYIKKVHPIVLSKIKDCELIIAGNSNKQSIQWLYKLIEGMPNVTVYNTPEDLTDIYSKGSIFVNPMLHGAGVKLKTVDAIINGLPVVSTSIGNEGTGLIEGHDIFVYDKPDMFAECIIGFLKKSPRERKEFVQNSQSTIADLYDTRAILKKYLSRLEQ